ncbi:MAG: ferric reductase-like transmembrane domain-containing protein [Acidobacteriota bacterium]|jgi:DMSO/TMAO reductase YedYZ heme-binding membrane subunit|nr:ferric reductase-like transmembrane domain-containing protein [Acidobacteriota bacterium]
MSFLLTLAITTALALALRKPLQRRPGVFYALALLSTGFYLYANYIDTSLYGAPWPLALVQRGGVALALFALVMFAGVFAKGSKPRALLLPLRRQLAIIGFILALGHIVVYTATFAPQLFDDDIRLDRNIVASLAVALAVTLLLAALAATSPVAVRKLIAPARWKRVQTLAYPFFLLIFLHLALVLLPSALAGSVDVAVSLAVYAALFASYGVLRLRRNRLDKGGAVETAPALEAAH